jgi:hypothetical protein
MFTPDIMHVSCFVEVARGNVCSVAMHGLFGRLVWDQ